jgi:chorismate synthase
MTKMELFRWGLLATVIQLLLNDAAIDAFRVPMMMGTGNSFGRVFRISTWGESHGGGVGVTLDGCPPRIPLTREDVQYDLDRRRPGQSRITTPRNEADSVEIMSGLNSDNITLGTPIAMLVRNQDQRSQDYLENDMNVAYRPSHADATYDAKYGVRAIAGGGRSSARETIGRVAAGAIARKILKMYNGIEVLAYVSKVQDIETKNVNHDTFTMEDVDSNMVRCPDQEAAEKMLARIDEIRKSGNSIGGVVTCIARNVPAGLGSPVFDKLEADLAKACMSIPAAKGFESGDGFEGTLLTGKDHNDEFYIDPTTGATRTRTNRSGGIQGGISNGENIEIRVAFKPTSTIGQVQVRLLLFSLPLEGSIIVTHFINSLVTRHRVRSRVMDEKSSFEVRDGTILVSCRVPFPWWRPWLP